MDKPEDVAPTSPKAVARDQSSVPRLPRPKPSMAPKLLAELQQQPTLVTMGREEQGYSLRSSNLVDPIDTSIRTLRRQAPRLQR